MLASLGAKKPAPAGSPADDPDAPALALARKYLAGGEGSRAALLEALDRMGWGVRDAKGEIVRAPPAGNDSGLALRDYEVEELLWRPSEQPAVRLISVARALAVPFETADPEELAQALVEALRASAESTQPQQRFWARFVVALGRVSPAGYDLLASAPPAVIPPSRAEMREHEKEAMKDPMVALRVGASTPAWRADDPVLGPSPRPTQAAGPTLEGQTERDERRLNELSGELDKLTAELSSSDTERQHAAQAKLDKLTAEMHGIMARQQAANLQQMAASMQRSENGEGAGEEEDSGSRFMAEWRDQPLSFLQIALITKVLAADLRQVAARGPRAGQTTRRPAGGFFPLAVIQVAQAPSDFTPFGEQFAGAAGDIWAGGWGAYTGAVIDRNLPENKFTKGTAIANTIIAWFKIIMTVTRQEITITVENEPLVRTKTRAPGERRTARAKIVIDFPKSDVLKAIRAAGSLTTVDPDLPEGGPVAGARVVWRLPEGSYNGKYQTAKGGWTYRPDLAVVQFARAGGSAAYISTTNDAGEATITIEGVPQRKELSKRVRPYPRRAMVAVEVTIKVGNMTQDLTDAINTAMGGVVTGGLGFVAEMVERSSFFFQAGQPFEVTDWKEPTWEGDFEITVKGAGSQHEKGRKGGPDVDLTWRMDRFMEGRFHTPEWEEEAEAKSDDSSGGRHRLEVDGDPRYFRLDDSSSSKSLHTENAYEAVGPVQIQAPGRNRLALYSRAEPSGSAELLFTGGKMMLDLKPFFGAECIVGRAERNRARTSRRVGTEFLSLLGGVFPDTFALIEDYDGSGDFIEGTKTFDRQGTLPYVPPFDVSVTVKYRLWKNNPPPPNK